jgi:hypothetical protein
MPALTQGASRTPVAQQGWPAVFSPNAGMFGPGTPLIPVDPQPVRSFDFVPGQNTNIQPRAYEGFSFAELRSFANVELVRLCIETRKDQIERMDWQIRPKDGRKKRADADERVRKIERFFAKPDGQNDFHTFMRTIYEDLLVLDAPAAELRRNRAGELIGLDHVPGDTIHLLVDGNGRRPLAPAPFAQQIIRGRVWADLTTEDIIYMPRNPRSGKLYGYGPVEQIVVTINTALRRQASQLHYFTDGNVPAGLATVPDTWTVDQVKQWQEWIDSKLSGNLAERRKLLWAPAGAQYQSFKEAPLKDDSDEWFARIICFCFSLPPTPFIKQMNRSTAQADAERSQEEGMAPQLTWGKRFVDRIIHEEFGFRDLEFAWGHEKALDPEVQAAVHDKYVRMGAYNLDDVRDDQGKDPIPGGLGKEYRVYTATGATPLDQVDEPPVPPVNAPGLGGVPAPRGAPKPTPRPQARLAGGGGSGDDSRAKKLAAAVAELMRLAPDFAAA